MASQVLEVQMHIVIFCLVTGGAKAKPKDKEKAAKAKARGRHAAKVEPAKAMTANQSNMEIYSVAETGSLSSKKSAADDLNFECMQWGRHQRIQIAGVRRLLQQCHTES